MNYDQDLLLNFPKFYNPHARGAREYFYDCGTPLSTDVGLQELEDGTTCVNFCYQKQLSCNNTNLILIPRGPCRPIIPPNPYFDISGEPCMSHLLEEDKDVDELLTFLTFFVSHCKRPKRKVVQMLRERLEKIRSFREDSKQEQTPNNPDAVPHFIYVDQKDDKRLRSLAGVIRRQKNVFRDYTLLWKNSYNPSYAGGCASFQPIDGHREVIGSLVFPMGRKMNRLTSGVVSFKHRSELTMSENAKSRHRMDDIVCQVTTETVKNRIFCLARTNNGFSFFSLEDEGSRLNHLDSPVWPKDRTLSHVALSPHLLGESLLCSQDGSVYLWSLERSNREIYKVPALDDPIERAMVRYPTYGHFTGHPRCFLVATMDTLDIVDSRMANGMSSRLFSLSRSEACHRGERITCSYKPNPSSTHHLFASQLSLGVVDERFPGHLVLKWNHSLLSPPTFMDVMPGIMGVEDETLITLGCQDYGEVHCFQAHGVATPFEQLNPHPSRVQICGLPWRTCRPEEMLTASFRNIKRRLACPLIGHCIVPNESQKGFSIIQLTSVGDLFAQDYQGDQGSAKDSKVFQKPSDAQSSQNLNNFKALFTEWLKECHVILDDDDYDLHDDSDNEIHGRNIRWLKIKRMRVYKEVMGMDEDDGERLRIEFPGCSTSRDTRSSDCDKCRARDDDYDGNDDDDDDSKYDPSCMACRMRRFQNAVRQDKVPPPLKDFDASKLTSAVQIQPLDDDVDGQILFAQYHDYDFTEFLKMRDEEIMTDFKELLKDNLPDEDDDKSDLELADRDVDDDFGNDDHDKSSTKISDLSMSDN